MEKIHITESQIDEALDVSKYLGGVERLEDYRSIEDCLPCEYDTNMDLHNIMGMIDRC